MLRTVPQAGHWSLNEHLVPRLWAPDVVGANAVAAALGGLLVIAVRWATSAPASLVDPVGAVTLVLLVAGVVLSPLTLLWRLPDGGPALAPSRRIGPARSVRVSALSPGLGNPIPCFALHTA